MEAGGGGGGGVVVVVGSCDRRFSTEGRG